MGVLSLFNERSPNVLESRVMRSRVASRMLPKKTPLTVVWRLLAQDGVSRETINGHGRTLGFRKTIPPTTADSGQSIQRRANQEDPARPHHAVNPLTLPGRAERPIQELRPRQYTRRPSNRGLWCCPQSAGAQSLPPQTVVPRETPYRCPSVFGYAGKGFSSSLLSSEAQSFRYHQVSWLIDPVAGHKSPRTGYELRGQSPKRRVTNPSGTTRSSRKNNRQPAMKPPVREWSVSRETHHGPQ